MQGSIDLPDGWTPAPINVCIPFSYDGKHWADVAATEAG